MRPDRQRLLLCAGLFAALLVCLGPIGDPDLPWHLSAGRAILATGRVPRADFLSWTFYGKPWFDFEWGAEVFFYLLEKAGGQTALWLFKSAAYFLLTLQFTALLFLWDVPEVWAAFAAPAFALAFFPLAEVRPEIFSFCLFSLQLYLLERRRLGRLRMGDDALLAAEAALYAVWANLHAGFVMGLGLCVLYGAAERLRPAGNAARRRSPLYWAGAGLIGTMANPYGPGLYDVLGIHLAQQGQLRRLITEWETPSFARYHLDGYWLLLIFSFAGLITASVQGAALPPEHLVTAVVFALFASRAVRTVSYSLLTVFPLSLAAWRRATAPRWFKPLQVPLLGLALGFFAWRTLLVVRILGVLTPPPPLEAQGPRGALAYLRAQKGVLGRLRLFNPYNLGGYLGYGLAPDYKVFMDGRYLFADILDETDAVKTDPARWRGLLDGHRIDLVFLENEGVLLRPFGVTEGRPYTYYSLPPAEWALLYWDSEVVLFVRRSAVDPEWLARREYRFLRPHDAHYILVSLLAGLISPLDVSAEMERYRKEIGDPRQVLELASMASQYQRALAAAGRR